MQQKTFPISLLCSLNSNSYTLDSNSYILAYTYATITILIIPDGSIHILFTHYIHMSFTDVHESTCKYPVT